MLKAKWKCFLTSRLSSTNIFNSDPFLIKPISDDVTPQWRASLFLHKSFQVHFFRTICLHHIKGSLLKVKSVQNNITQRIQIGVSHLYTHTRKWRRILVRLLSLVLKCRRYTCNMAAGTAWDTVPIWEQKWPATLLIPVFTPGMPAKLTQVQFRRHAHVGGRALRWL